VCVKPGLIHEQRRMGGEERRRGRVEDFGKEKCAEGTAMP